MLSEASQYTATDEYSTFSDEMKQVRKNAVIDTVVLQIFVCDLFLQIL